MAQLADLHAKDPLDAILITGDMTDAGQASEWAEFLDAIAPHPQLAERILALPGNHDLNVADRANPARLELPTSPNRRLRSFVSCRCCLPCRARASMSWIMRPVFSAVVWPARAPYLLDVARFANTGRPLVSKAIADLWNEVFPMIVPPDSDTGLGIILLNSNVDTQFSFTSASG